MHNLADPCGIEPEAAMKEPSYRPGAANNKPQAWARGLEIKATQRSYLIRILFATAGASLGKWTTSTPS
jgi:hypothetical protein